MSVDVKYDYHKMKHFPLSNRLWSSELVQSALKPKKWQPSASFVDASAVAAAETTTIGGDWPVDARTMKLFEGRLADALRQRDGMWRERQRLEVAQTQERCDEMLTALHREIEKLHNVNRELERRLYVAPEVPLKPELERVKRELADEHRTCVELRRQLVLAAKRNASLAQTLEKSAQMYKDQIAHHEEKIRQLHDELISLNDRNASLSSQLRAARSSHHQSDGPLFSHRSTVAGKSKATSMSPTLKRLSLNECTSIPRDKSPGEQGKHKLPTAIPRPLEPPATSSGRQRKPSPRRNVQDA